MIYLSFLINAWLQGHIRQLALLSRRVAGLGELHEHKHLLGFIDLFKTEAKFLNVARERIDVVETALDFRYQKMAAVNTNI